MAKADTSRRDFLRIGAMAGAAALSGCTTINYALQPKEPAEAKPETNPAQELKERLAPVSGSICKLEKVVLSRDADTMYMVTGLRTGFCMYGYIISTFWLQNVFRDSAPLNKIDNHSAFYSVAMEGGYRIQETDSGRQSVMMKKTFADKKEVEEVVEDRETGLCVYKMAQDMSSQYQGKISLLPDSELSGRKVTIFGMPLFEDIEAITGSVLGTNEKNFHFESGEALDPGYGGGPIIDMETLDLLGIVLGTFNPSNPRSLAINKVALKAGLFAQYIQK